MTEKELFIYENYELLSTKEISILLNIHESSVRRIASRVGKTKRNKLEEPVSLFDIDGFSNYGVDETHNVIRRKDNVIIKLSVNEDGYVTLRLSDDNGKRKTLQYHRLLAIVFLDRPSNYEELQVNHIDGNKLNNDLSNLEWLTPSDNLKHAYSLGLRKSAKGNRKYTNEQIITVCNLLEVYKSPKKVYDMLSGEVGKTVIQQIYSKRRWTDLSKDYNF